MQAVELVEHCIVEVGMPDRDVQGKRFAEKGLQHICLPTIGFGREISREASLDFGGPDDSSHLGSWSESKNVAGDTD
jgi:hypothetical protein